MSKKKNKHTSKKHTTKTAHQHLLKGRLEVTRSGMGYVIVEGAANDILVRPSDMGNALNGDTVRIKVVKQNTRTGKKEGRITEVIERKQTEFVGSIQLSAHFAFFCTGYG